MQATPAKGEPRLDPGDWAFELKWDGIRALATVREGRVTLRSRNGNDLTAQYPELQELAERAGVDGVYDGEIVALDDRGRPSFQLLQNRMGLTKAREVEAARGATPVRLLLFDVLEADGHELTRHGYTARREALATVVDPGGAIEVPDAVDGDFAAALAESERRGLEGVVAKKRGSRYAEGRRSEAWLKVKHHATQEVVVGGWKPGAGRRAGGIGSLLLGCRGRRVSSTSARSAPGSATVTWTQSPVRSSRWRAGRRRSWTSLDRMPVTRSGSDRSGSVRSSSRSGPATDGSDSPRGVGGARTRTLTTSCASPDRAHARAWGPPRANFRPPFGAPPGDDLGAARHRRYGGCYVRRDGRA